MIFSERIPSDRTVSRTLPGVPAALLLLVLASPCLGGVDTWTSGGPGGEYVMSVVVDPTSSQTLYAGAYDGVFRSVDGGTSWAPAGLANVSVLAVLIDPQRTATLYAVGSNRDRYVYIYKTTDGASTWRVVGSLGSNGGGSLWMDPVNSETLYAAGGLFSAGGFYKSTDGASSWTRVEAGLPTWGICNGCPQYVVPPGSLAIDPSAPSTLYAHSGQIYRSTNGGASWSKFSYSAPDGTLLIDRSSTLFLVGSRGICQLTSAHDWSCQGPGGLFAADPSEPGTLYFAQQASTDTVSQPNRFATVIVKCVGWGSSCAPIGNGLAEQYVASLAVDPTGRFLHAGTGRNVAGSPDSGHGVWDFEITRPAESPVVPIVLDVGSESARYTTELTLTNDTPSPRTVDLVYTASLGAPEGSGTVAATLQPGEQKRIGDVLAYLRDGGLAIPSAGSGEGGTLRIVTPEATGAGRVAALARTATDTRAPLPPGRAGLAYGTAEAFPGHSALRVFGLRSSETDRSNLAIVNTAADPMTVRITVFSGSGDGRSAVVRDGQTLPPYGWVQINSPELLDAIGIADGWALVERTSELGGLYAYGVVNDRVTNDGSFLAPAPGGQFGSIIPVLVETPAFGSELVLANRSEVDARLSLRYVESLTPGGGAGDAISITLPARTQRIVPSAIDFLRRRGVVIGPAGGRYGGSMAVSLEGGPPADALYAGARTASPAAGEGEFGLFTPGVSDTAGTFVCRSYTFETVGLACTRRLPPKAWIYGLVADERNRSNVAVLNASFEPASSSSVALRLEVHDGDAGGAVKGDPIVVTLAPGQWKQFDGILKAAGVSNGWVEITQTSTDFQKTPWIAYGVINDGARPGERTGDGAYVPMTK